MFSFKRVILIHDLYLIQQCNEKEFESLHHHVNEQTKDSDDFPTDIETRIGGGAPAEIMGLFPNDLTGIRYDDCQLHYYTPLDTIFKATSHIL